MADWQGDMSAQAGATDPYDIGAGSQIGQGGDSDELTDVYEKLAGTSATVANADGNLSDPDEMSPGTNSMSADSNLDGLTDGPEMSYQSDPLLDIHRGPWNQGLPGSVRGPQPDQGGLGEPHPGPGGLGGPHPDQGDVDPAGSDHLDTGPLDLN